LLFGLILGCLYFQLFLYVFSKSAHFFEFFKKYILLANISDIGYFYYALLFLVFVPTLINLTMCLFCCKLIKSKRLLIEKNNDFCKLRNSKILAYFLFWFAMGLILGLYILGIIMLYILETNKIFLAHTIRWTFYDKFALVFIIVISLLVMLLSLIFYLIYLKKLDNSLKPS
jgi:hypothetical protein